MEKGVRDVVFTNLGSCSDVARVTAGKYCMCGTSILLTHVLTHYSSIDTQSSNIILNPMWYLQKKKVDGPLSWLFKDIISAAEKVCEVDIHVENEL